MLLILTLINFVLWILEPLSLYVGHRVFVAVELFIQTLKLHFLLLDVLLQLTDQLLELLLVLVLLIQRHLDELSLKLLNLKVVVLDQSVYILTLFKNLLVLGLKILILECHLSILLWCRLSILSVTLIICIRLLLIRLLSLSVLSHLKDGLKVINEMIAALILGPIGLDLVPLVTLILLLVNKGLYLRDQDV